MTAPTATDTVAHILEQVVPVIEEFRDTGETERKMDPHIVEAMRRAGVFRMMVPRALGGLELDGVSQMRIIERIATADGSAGWVSGNNPGFPYMCQMLADDGAREVLSSPDVIIAGGGFPPGQAVPIDGGYRVSGHANFASGSQYAEWLWSLNVILEDGQPRMHEGEPVLLWAFMRSSDATIVDNWDTLGQRGTGSHDTDYHDVFVPERLAFVLGPMDHPGPCFQGPLYRTGLWLPVAGLGAAALGIARAVVDEGTRIAGSKTPNYMTSSLAQSSAVHRLVGRAEAMVRAARASFYEAMRAMQDRCESGARATLEDGVAVQLACCFAMETATTVANMMHEVAGTTGIRKANRLERLFRDAQTHSRHAFAAAPRYDSSAQVLLGLQSDWPFFYL
jgi:alkylation response protein AidB-like acyl-CoA dehydrogenase